LTKREIVKMVLDGKIPPYVPWSFGFTQDAKAKLQQHFGAVDLEDVLQNHVLKLGSDIGFFEDIGDDCVRDVFGVIWDRSVNKDIGIPKGCMLSKPTLKGYAFPDPLAPRFFDDIPAKIVQYGDRFRVFQIGFSLYERAWTLRGLQNLLMDFYDHPGFVDELLNAIADLDHRYEIHALDRQEFLRQREESKRQLRRIALLMKM
jgi:uroporphyrinogen decarboxylase